jgi:hypothetical protein
MNLKELSEAIAPGLNMPATEVRKVCLAMLEKFAELIESQASFSSPVVTFTPTTRPAQPAKLGQPEKSEVKSARLTIRDRTKNVI